MFGQSPARELLKPAPGSAIGTGPYAGNADAGLPAPFRIRRGLFGNGVMPLLSEGQPPRPFDQDLPQPHDLAAGVSGQPARSGLLGGSRRQAYDYDRAMQSLLPHANEKNTFAKIMEVAGPALMYLGGNAHGGDLMLANLRERREREDQRRWEAGKLLAGWKYRDWARTDDAELDASMPFTIGRSRLQYDPDSGAVQTLYDGAEDFEDYAETLGLEPGTQAYFDAVEDYVLRANGPTALENDKTLDSFRTGNRLRLEGARQGNRISLENLRQGHRTTLRGTPSYRDTHPLPPRSGAAPRAVRPTATGPNGQKIEFDGKQWVPVR